MPKMGKKGINDLETKHFREVFIRVILSPKIP
jgi:hypothetical protein